METWNTFCNVGGNMKWYGHWKKDKWQAGSVTGGRELTYYAKGPGFNPQNHKRQTNKQKMAVPQKLTAYSQKDWKGNHSSIMYN